MMKLKTNKFFSKGPKTIKIKKIRIKLEKIIYEKLDLKD